MNKRIIPLLILILATAATAQVPTYQLETILPAPWCTSVDMSPDGTKICARKQFDPSDGVNGAGYRFLDASTYEVISDCQLNGCPWTGLFSSDSAYLWTTIYYGGYVKKIDPNTCEVLTTIDLGSWTVGLAFDSHRRYLYVGENDPGRGAIGSLKVVDTDTETLVYSLTLNGEPSLCIVVDPADEFVYLFSRNAGSETLYKIRTAPDCVLEDSLPVDGLTISGHTYAGFSLSPDGGTLYLPYPESDLVYVIDTATLTVADTWLIPSPAGFFVSPDGTHALVTSSNANNPNIRVFDLLSKEIIQVIDVGDVGASVPSHHDKTPYWDNVNGKVYVNLCSLDGGVVVLSVAEPAIIAVDVDIKPGSCPNPLNVKSWGVLPVAIVGTEDFDVNAVDVASIRLADVAPIRSSFEDVATPVTDGNECECTTEGPDGYTDLTLKFETEEIVETLGDVNDGDVLALTLTGCLFDGTTIEGQDCIVSVGNASKKPKGDLNADGIVDLRDFSVLADRWLEGTGP